MRKTAFNLTRGVAFVLIGASAAWAQSRNADLPHFRWPARGEIIKAFGQGNDGINIRMREGTAVVAVEDGVVAYAGNELKGYGQLILVRHTNSYVSAYAYNSELLVKRGDTVKKNQTIAKSGATGNADEPQLHFEVRKGSTPIDPLTVLSR